jgi:hypothetical protein
MTKKLFSVHWIPLHHQKPNKFIKNFPSTIHRMDSHQKQANNKAKAYFIGLYNFRVKVIVLN